MKELFVIFYFSLFCYLTIQAQKNYKSGYIITNNKDTILGYIDCGAASQNARACHFKSALTDSVQLFLPDQIDGYQFTTGLQKKYVSKSMTLNGTSKTVFLESHVQGTISLYSLTEVSDAKTKPLYFFENENGEVNVLTKDPDKIIESKNNISKIRVDNKYKGILHYIFRKYESVGLNSSNAKFELEDMVSLTKKYNKTVLKSGIEVRDFKLRYKHFFKLNYSIYGGINDCFNGVYLGSSALKYSSPVIGAQINLSIPNWIKSFSLQADLSASKSNREEENIYHMLINGTHHWENLFSAEFGAKYTYWRNVLRPSIEGAFDYKYQTNLNYLGNFKYPGYYVALGLNPSLGNDHNLLVSFGFEKRSILLNPKPSAILFHESAMVIKLGFTY